MQWQDNYFFYLKVTLLLHSCPPSFTFLLHQVLQSSEVNLQLANGEVATLQEVIQPDPSSGQIPYGEFATHAADVISSLYQNQPASDVSGRGYLSSFPGLPIVQFPTLQVIKIWKRCLGMCKGLRSGWELFRNHSKKSCGSLERTRQIGVHLILQLSRYPCSQTSPVTFHLRSQKYTEAERKWKLKMGKTGNEAT